MSKASSIAKINDVVSRDYTSTTILKDKCMEWLTFRIDVISLCHPARPKWSWLAIPNYEFREILDIERYTQQNG
jgi:hypothetical protein